MLPCKKWYFFFSIFCHSLPPYCRIKNHSLLNFKFFLVKKIMKLSCKRLLFDQIFLALWKIINMLRPLFVCLAVCQSVCMLACQSVCLSLSQSIVKALFYSTMFGSCKCWYCIIIFWIFSRKFYTYFCKLCISEIKSVNSPNFFFRQFLRECLFGAKHSSQIDLSARSKVFPIVSYNW